MYDITSSRLWYISNMPRNKENPTGRSNKPSGIEPGLAVADPKEYHRQYYLRNREKRLEQSRRWIEKNPEKHLAALGKWKKSERGQLLVKRQRARRLQRQKDFINGFKNRPCADCGIQYPSYVMDFHHRDPSDKDFTVARIKGKPRKVIKAEIEKCDLVCANCHRERHHGEGLD